MLFTIKEGAVVGVGDVTDGVDMLVGIVVGVIDGS
jgi:hypothetical protein